MQRRLEKRYDRRWWWEGIDAKERDEGRKG
jgi:hypothetical protein